MTLMDDNDAAWPDKNDLLEYMIRDVTTLAVIESPTHDLGSVLRVMDVVEDWALELGAQTRALPGGTRELNFGLDPKQPDQPYLLVLMHADTVWPVGTLPDMPIRREGDCLYGPGTYDMKGGIVGFFHALRLLRKEGNWPKGGIKALLTPDEETGSASSWRHIEQAARNAKAVLVVEPPVADTHCLKTGRKGTGSVTLRFAGIASHAGNHPDQGASAITAAAEAVLALQALANPEEGTTICAGMIQGGTATNVVPASCTVQLDLRAASAAESERIMQQIRAWRPTDERVQVHVSGGMNRPPFEPTEQNMALFRQAQAIAHTLGFELDHSQVGGGSDGNFTAALAPTLDGLGAPGDGAHAQHEHIRLDRWADHVRLLSQLMKQIP